MMNFKNSFQKISKWALTSTSVFTMVMLPVAQGQAAQSQSDQISKAQVQSAVTQLGLNKSMTLGEFYQKNKNLYPERIQKQLAQFIAANKDYVMPTFEVTTAKNSEGKDVPSVRISKDGELINVQVFGEKEKYVKFNNTNLTEVDIINFKDMFLKLNNGDANLRKQVEKANLSSTTPKASTQFTGFPAITKEIWSGYSARDKAEYILNMRQLWSDAQKVLSTQEKKSSKKTSSFEFFWNKFIQDAEAEPRGSKSSSAAPAKATNCLIAGYVSAYDGKSCALKDIRKDYSESIYYKPANDTCKKKGASFIACNPVLYGMPKDQNSELCVNTSDKTGDFQIATHYEGPCDKASRLGTKVDFLKDDKKTNDRYSDGNRTMTPEELEAAYKKQQSENSSYVENYLKSFFEQGIDFSKALGDSEITKILDIQKAFNDDIVKARSGCLGAAKLNLPNEKNFWGACDQLQRRFLFVAEFLKEKPGCKDSVMNPSTLKCTCKGPNASEVNPGAKCTTSETPAPTASGKCPTGMSEDSTGGGLQCLCTNGAAGNWTIDQARASGFNAAKECKLNQNPAPGVSAPGGITTQTGSCGPNQTLVSATPGGAGTCVDDKPTKPEKEDSNWFSGFFKKALPWLVGGVALFAMYKLWSPKKPALNSAGDYCPNGTRPPCGQICTAPLSNINGACGCAACAPGQTLTNAATCTCSTSTTTTTDITCPDGVTKAATLAQCPVTAQYTCWDGSKVANAINCPEKPATSTTGTGGSTK